MTEVTFSDDQALMRSYIQRIATGPELSKDLSRAEARDGMTQILTHRADPVQAAIYLIALRMKRETDDENAGVLDALLSIVRHASAALDDLVEIADPYDGFVRGTPASTFLAPVLAALGIPTVLTGAQAVGPKYGVTHHMILKAAGVGVLKSPDEVTQQLEDSARGWSYADQARFAPALHGLLGLRTQMVKRTVLTTLEVLLRPVHARHTHLMTGYVHKPYPPRYLRLARQAGYHSAMAVRGVEGGVIPSLIQPSKYFNATGDGEHIEVRLTPEELGIAQNVRIAALPADAEHREPDGQPFASINTGAVAAHAARHGVEALKGASGPFRDSLVFGASICLTHLKHCDSLAEAASRAREVLDDGSALARFESALDR